MDSDALDTLGVIDRAEKTLKTKISTNIWNPPPPPPRDYFVPDFGQDEDVSTTLKNGRDAEFSTGITFVGAKPPPPPPMDYAVPDFGPDRDITDSQVNLAAQEQKMKHKIVLKTREQLKATRDAFPVDYQVPDFGIDQDISTTLRNAKTASDTLGVNWDPMNLIQAQEDLRLHHKRGHRHR